MAKKIPKSVLVTGSEGFAGSHLIKVLQEALYKVEPTCRPLTASKNDKCIPLDILNLEMVKDVVATYKPNIIVHLAAVTSVAKSLRDPIRTYDTNVIGTANLIEACKDMKKKVRFLYISSSEVYGGGTSCSEKSPINLRNPIAVSKYAAELIIQNTVIDNLEYIILRPFSHTGPGQSENFVLPTVARQVAEIEQNKRPPLLELGNIEVVREFMNITDIVNAYCLAIAKCEPGALYNISSNRGYSVADAVEVFKKASKATFEVKLLKSRLRRNEIAGLVGNGSAFTKCLKPRTKTAGSIWEHKKNWFLPRLCEVRKEH